MPPKKTATNKAVAKKLVVLTRLLQQQLEGAELAGVVSVMLPKASAINLSSMARSRLFSVREFANSGSIVFALESHSPGSQP